MRIAIFSDIHGNSIALDAVLADIHIQGGVDEYWLLGDYAAIGPDPVGCLERIAELPNATCTVGNTDRYIAEGLDPGEFAAKLRGDPEKVLTVPTLYFGIAWAQGALTVTGWLDWLKALPLEHRATLPDGTRFLGVHASPGRDDSRGLHPDQSADALRELFSGAKADLVCVGHTHFHMQTELDGIRLVNLGSLSNPFPPELRASYVLLEADEQGHTLEHHFVDYDRQAVARAAAEVRHPEMERIASFMRGEVKAGWMR